jgi:hypothetical protein
MLFGGAVRKVHAYHIDTGFDDLGQYAGLVGRRTKRGQYLGSAEVDAHIWIYTLGLSHSRISHDHARINEVYQKEACQTIGFPGT